MATQARARSLRRLEGRSNKTACANELGDFQYVVLNAMRALSPRATVNSVLRLVLGETQDILDVAQTYEAIKTFKNKSWIRECDKTPSEEGGRPMATFAIEKAGREILKEREEHLERLQRFHHRCNDLSKLKGMPQLIKLV